MVASVKTDFTFTPDSNNAIIKKIQKMIQEKELYKNECYGDFTTLTQNDDGLYFVNVKYLSTHTVKNDRACLTQSEALNVAIEIFKNEGVPISDFVINSLKEQGKI